MKQKRGGEDKINTKVSRRITIKMPAAFMYWSK